jgi:hypothetical protein
MGVSLMILIIGLYMVINIQEELKSKWYICFLYAIINLIKGESIWQN